MLFFISQFPFSSVGKEYTNAAVLQLQTKQNIADVRIQKTHTKKVMF